MTLYESVLKSMRKNIEDGVWPRGEMIPREVDLCEQYGVSRSTIRMAMIRLVNEGLMTRVKGVGTFVTTGEHMKSTTLFMTSFARELEMQGKHVCTELLTFCTIPAVPEANAALKLPQDARLLKLVRLRYPQEEFDKGPIVLTTSYFDAKYHAGFQNCDWEKESMYHILESLGIVRRSFTKVISAQQLTERECRMMGVSAQCLAISVSSLALDQNGHELEYTVSLYPIEKNRFEIRVDA